MKDEQYSLNGFTFLSQADYNIALDEWNTILYVKKNSKLTNEVVVYKLYHKLIEKNAFKTVVGLSFLKELRDNLIKTGKYKEDDLEYIAVSVGQGSKATSDAVDSIKRQNYKEALRNSKIINIFLVITILVMFVITIYT